MHPRAVHAIITSLDGRERFEGAAVLRQRPHPVTGEPALHIGVPDDALGFRPRTGVHYAVRVRAGDGSEQRVTVKGFWLERVQSSWWFVLEDEEGWP